MLVRRSMVAESDGYSSDQRLPASRRDSCCFAITEVGDWQARLSPGASRFAPDREDSAAAAAASVGPMLPIAAVAVAEFEIGLPVAADASAGSTDRSCWRCFQLSLGTGRESRRCHCLERQGHCAFRHLA